MEEQKLQYESALSTLARFSQDEWLGWIAGILNNNYREPVIVLPRAEEINTLFWVFNRFSANRAPVFQDGMVNYCLAIVKYLEMVAPLEDNYPIIFTLIHFINGTRPFMCRHQIEQLIRSGYFENAIYNDVNLNYFLIKAYIPIENSQEKPLQRWMDRKLRTARHPYYYYVYFKYQFKYFDLRRAFSQIVGSQLQMNRAIAAEIAFALREIVVSHSSFGVVTEVFRTYLDGTEMIPGQLSNVVSMFEVEVQRILSRRDARSIENAAECRKVMGQIRRSIHEQTSQQDIWQASPRQSLANQDANISSTAFAYGSDTEVLDLIFQMNAESKRN